MKFADKVVITTLAITALVLGVFFSIKTNVETPLKKDPIAYGSIVRLVKDGKTYCSGVVVDKNTIFTAGHCIIVEKVTIFGIFLDLDPDPIEIRGPNNRELGVIGKAATASAQVDRGVITGDFRRFQYSPYLSDVPAIVNAQTRGTALVACGYPMGGPLFCFRSSSIGKQGFFLSIAGSLIPGMSGGPTMLADGTVIATNTAVEDDYSLVAPFYNIDLTKERAK